MKYTLSQYVHDGFRIRLIEQEITEIRSYKGRYEWVGTRLAELQEERGTLTERMYKFERHPNNR